MNSYFHLDNSFQNHYYPEAKPSYGQYEYSCDAYFDNSHEQQDSFLPKPDFFNTLMGNSPALDATRHCTDATDGSDATPLNFQAFTPTNITYPNAQPLSMGNLFGNFNGAELFGSAPTKTSSFTTVLGSNTRISFSTHNNQEMIYSRNRAESEESDSEEVPTKQLVAMEKVKPVAEERFWDEEKEETLMKYASQYKCDWKKIAKKFNNKKLTPHFLKNKYKEVSAGPSQRRIKFNHREDLMIAKYFEKYGSNWGQMAAHFNGRNGIMLKNRYYSFIRKRDLLEVLLQEVREVENDGCQVDNLATPEAERYTECMDMKRSGDYEYSSTNNETAEQEIFEDFSERSPSESAIQNALCYPNIETEASAENKEVEILKAKVKSLQALYLKTKAELDRVKNSQ